MFSSTHTVSTAKTAREDHGEHRLRGDLPQQLVQVHQPQAQQRLREEEQVERGEDRPQRGEGHAEARPGSRAPAKRIDAAGADGEVASAARARSATRCCRMRRSSSDTETSSAPSTQTPTATRAQAAVGQRRDRHREPEHRREQGEPPAVPQARRLLTPRNSRKKPSAADGTSAAEERCVAPSDDAGTPGEPALGEEAVEEAATGRSRPPRGRRREYSVSTRGGRGRSSMTARAPGRRWTRAARSGSGCPCGRRVYLGRRKFLTSPVVSRACRAHPPALPSASPASPPSPRPLPSCPRACLAAAAAAPTDRRPAEAQLARSGRGEGLAPPASSRSQPRLPLRAPAAAAGGQTGPPATSSTTWPRTSPRAAGRGQGGVRRGPLRQRPRSCCEGEGTPPVRYLRALAAVRGGD